MSEAQMQADLDAACSANGVDQGTLRPCRPAGTSLIKTNRV